MVVVAAIDEAFGSLQVYGACGADLASFSDGGFRLQALALGIQWAERYSLLGSRQESANLDQFGKISHRRLLERVQGKSER